MIPGFSCHGHGEISARRRAREEVADNYCHLPLFFSLSAPLLRCYSLLAKHTRQWATGGGHRNSRKWAPLGPVTDSHPKSSLCKIFIFSFDEMVDFMHLFCGVKTLRPLRLWPLFHSGFIIKQSFLPPLFPWH